MNCLEMELKARSDSDRNIQRFQLMVRASGGLTAQNVAVGSYANTSEFNYGRNIQHDREVAQFKSWVYSSIRPIAQTIAGLPVRVAQRSTEITASLTRPGPGPKRNYTRRRFYKATELGTRAPMYFKARAQDLDVYEDHPILHVLDQPNPQFTKYSLMFFTVCSLELTGKGHWWLTVDRETKQPCIWPIPSSWINPVHTKERSFDHWSMMPGGTSQPVDIPADEIVYFFWPDPATPLSVVSPLNAAGRAVLANDAIQDAQYRAFKQGIWPGLAVIAGDYIDDDGEGGRPLLERDQRQQIYAAIRRAWGGVMNINEPIILDALIKDVKQLTNKPAEMDFPESAKAKKAEITQTFGTNPAIMGEIEGLNRASSATAKSHFAEFTVNPKVQMLSEVMTYTIGTSMAGEGEQLYIWIEPYHPDDSAERRANYQLGAQYSCITKNEIRTQLCNLPPLGPGQGGDELVTPSQQGGGFGGGDFGNAGVAGTPSGKPVDQGNGGDAGAGGTANPDRQADQGIGTDAGYGGKSLTLSGRALIRHNKQIVKAMYLKAHGNQEKRLVGVLKEYFHDQGITVMKSLVRAWHAGKNRDVDVLVDAIFNAEKFDKQLRDAIEPELRASMMKGAYQESLHARAHYARKQLDLFIKAKPTVEDMLIDLPYRVERRIGARLKDIMDADFWWDVTKTTKKELAETIAEGLENGESLYQIACRIGDDPQTEVGLENPGIFTEDFGFNPIYGNGPSLARATLIARTECLRGDVVVNGANAVACHKRLYHGTMIEVVTEAGRKFTGTPNHPMLTQRGWVALGDLTESDYLVCDARYIQSPSVLGDVDVETPPTRIDQLFESLSAVGVMVRKRTESRDFHGDGIDGYVDIYCPDRKLRIGMFSPVNQSTVDFQFTPPDALSVNSLCVAAQCAAFGVYLPVCSGDAFGHRPNCSTRSADRVIDCGLMEAKLVRNFSGRQSRLVHCTNLGSWNLGLGVLVSAGVKKAACFRQRTTRNASVIQRCVNGLGAASNNGSNLFDTQSRTVQFDRLRLLRRIDSWSGHVYNLTTVDGYYSANGLYTGNTTLGLNAGHSLVLDDLEKDGIIEGRMWMDVEDVNTRNAHLKAAADYDEQNPIKGDAKFILHSELDGNKAGTEEAEYPGDINLSAGSRANCRCVISSVWSDEQTQPEE